MQGLLKGKSKSSQSRSDNKERKAKKVASKNSLSNQNYEVKVKPRPAPLPPEPVNPADGLYGSMTIAEEEKENVSRSESDRSSKVVAKNFKQKKKKAQIGKKSSNASYEQKRKNIGEKITQLSQKMVNSLLQKKESDEFAPEKAEPAAMDLAATREESKTTVSSRTQESETKLASISKRSTESEHLLPVYILPNKSVRFDAKKS
ncbi:unnamed protein product [Caenorhabditis bovis]|uniref:Uncharacterized protein n=1 Tax=Caenorhabditis bovis TaxID=2654633 RepID=A0A8S1FG86_9PELO|nr:unnamed protein product [Caenorhabditis bovis]